MVSMSYMLFQSVTILQYKECMASVTFTSHHRHAKTYYRNHFNNLLQRQKKLHLVASCHVHYWISFKYSTKGRQSYVLVTHKDNTLTKNHRLCTSNRGVWDSACSRHCESILLTFQNRHSMNTTTSSKEVAALELWMRNL
jgi:hypothetical protein